MSNKNNTVNQSNNQALNSDDAAFIDEKVTELVGLIKQAKLSNTETRAIQQKINVALGGDISPEEKIEAFKILDDIQLNREDLLGDLEILLTTHQIDNKISSKYLLNERIKKTSVLIIGIIMLTLGFAMIIMPAPPYFEMFTIFYFNQNDGVTLMDLISLLIVFTGIYLIVTSILKSKPRKAQNE